MTRVASSVSTGSPARLSVWSVTSMRSPMWRSSVFTCSSCWPSSSRKRRGSSKRRACDAGATGSAKGSAPPGAEQVVGRGERLVEPGGVLAAGLREVGPPAPAAAHERCELLDDVAGVEAADEVVGDRGEQQRTLALRRAEHDDTRLDAGPQPIGHVAEPLVVESVDPRRQHGDAVDTACVGEHVARGTARELPLELGNALLELALLREELLELRRRLLLGAAQERGDLAQQRLVAADRVERALAGRRLEPPYAGRHAALAAHLEEADVARTCDVRAAAELDGVLAHVNHRHAVAVLLAEERECTRLDGTVVGHLLGPHLEVGADLRVHLVLDLGERLLADRPRVREVEAQPLGRHERAGLPDVRAEPVAECRVHEMRRGMVEPRRLAPADVDPQADPVADRHGPLAHDTAMRDDRRCELLRVEHLDACRAVRRLEPAAVAHLPARFRIEGRLGGHDVDLRSGAERATRLAALRDEGQHLRFPFRDAVADEPGAERRRPRHDLGRRLRIGELLGTAGPLALRFHGALEARAVDGKTLSREDVLGEVERESVGVVEAERDLARERSLAGLAYLRDLALEQRETPIERGGEALLFLAHHFHGA